MQVEEEVLEFLKNNNPKFFVVNSENTNAKECNYIIVSKEEYIKIQNGCNSDSSSDSDELMKDLPIPLTEEEDLSNPYESMVIDPSEGVENIARDDLIKSSF